MIISEKIQYKVIPNTRKYYISKGYVCNNYDIIEVNIIDLPITSGIKIDVKCDSCGKEKKLAYKNYLKNTKNNTIIYTCSGCSNFKVRKTKLEKYGDENYQNTEKIKKTKLEKYGDENFTGREKSKITCLNKYGVDNVSKSNIIKILKKETNNKKWGVDNVFQSEEIKDKISKTINEKYGSDVYIKSQDFKIKYKLFCNDIGVDHYSKSLDYKNKFKQTCLLKFGFETNLMSPEVKKIIKETNILKYGFSIPMKNTTISRQVAERIINSRHSYFNILGYTLLDYDFENNEYFLEKNECKHQFKINYDLFRSRIKYSNSSCLICFPKDELSSIKEKELGNWLIGLNLNVIQSDRKILNGKELDFYIPDKNLAIEFNGLYWHSDKFKEKKYHLNKTVDCKNQLVSLLHIWEDDWVFRKDIVKSILLNKLGLIENKIMARKCKIDIINNKESNLFLKSNHIQGGTPASICLCLKYNSEIVSVMTFGKRRLNNKDSFELIRFCNKLNTNVIGGASKLFSFFLKNYKYENIISYSDISIFSGNLYKKLGFSNDGETNLNYYWTDLVKKYHRFNFNKKKLIKLGYDKQKTEEEIMKEIGYYKIWSCGQIRWIYDDRF